MSNLCALPLVFGRSAPLPRSCSIEHFFLSYRSSAAVRALIPIRRSSATAVSTKIFSALTSARRFSSHPSRARRTATSSTRGRVASVAATAASTAARTISSAEGQLASAAATAVGTAAWRSFLLIGGVVVGARPCRIRL